MGNFIAGIVSNFIKRDFTKTPLTDEEIDVLIGQIPKDDVLESLNQEDKKIIMNNYPVDDLVQRLGQPEREKIVKAMSDQKIFNLKGDNIFDYYVTNNKNELRNCMKGHMNKDGTLCEDEKFKRMITRIPDLVQGPLEEKQSYWEGEKQSLQKQWGIDKTQLEGDKQVLQERYNTLDAAYDSLQEQNDALDAAYDILKGDIAGLEGLQAQWGVEKQGLEDDKEGLQSKYDTLEQQNLGKLALARFLKDPQMHNNMLKNNISQKTLNIFTKDGGIKIDIKEFLELSWVAPKIVESYDTRESYLPTLIDEMKDMSIISLSKFNKDFATDLKSKGNLKVTEFILAYLTIKVITQYNSPTKIVSNEKIYNDYKEFFIELGIEQQQFESVIKFIAFNTFKKFMDYESNNDVPGLNFHLIDYLKIVEEYMGKEYINTSIVVPKFDTSPWHHLSYYSQTDKGKPFSYYKEVRNSSENVMNISPSGCDKISKTLYPDNIMSTKNWSGVPQGCVHHPKTKKVYWNKSKGQVCNSNEQFSCFQKTPRYISEEQCKKYSELINASNYVKDTWDNKLKGCSIHTPTNRVFFNTHKTGDGLECGKGSQKCIQKPFLKKHYLKSGKPPINSEYELVVQGDPDHSVSEDECQDYGGGSSLTRNPFHYLPSGCYKRHDGTVAWGKHGQAKADCESYSANVSCVQKKNTPIMSEEDCKDYANLHGGPNRLWAGAFDYTALPIGCVYNPEKNQYLYNIFYDPTFTCSDKWNCVVP